MQNLTDLFYNKLKLINSLYNYFCNINFEMLVLSMHSKYKKPLRVLLLGALFSFIVILENIYWTSVATHLDKAVIFLYVALVFFLIVSLMYCEAANQRTRATDSADYKPETRKHSFGHHHSVSFWVVMLVITNLLMLELKEANSERIKMGVIFQPLEKYTVSVDIPTAAGVDRVILKFINDEALIQEGEYDCNLPDEAPELKEKRIQEIKKALEDRFIDVRNRNPALADCYLIAY